MLSAATAPDYRGRRHELRLPAVPGSGDRVLLVDDRAERQPGRGGAEPVRRQGAELLGLALVVDELPDAVRTRLGRGGPVQRLAPSLRGVRTGSSFSGGCAGWPGARRP
ncbi:hypothetical protein SAMN05660209_02315 [Geodermatophilus africanus]|uniref:Phosphoribosyl transferase domain-containing protein n=1 Tax=Geodermatophilus africanus TaxID=1137993 RepID=A0A1H3I0G3_9ACTN|nr:hypothetical protein [Geodermatophilus africanus]SDY20534.1 hypothetical protein SAMN05660209_02315 [Geodermatophilus africanus]